MERHASSIRYGLTSENSNLAVPNLPLVSPEEAQRLLDQGYTYVDVRSEPEFALGRPPRAVNVPLLQVEGDRLVDNPEFDVVMQALFRTTDPLIVGCRSGSRSRVAMGRLRGMGFDELVELRYGFAGARDAFGRRLPGWIQAGLPVEAGKSELGEYGALLARCPDRQHVERHPPMQPEEAGPRTFAIHRGGEHGSPRRG